MIKLYNTLTHQKEFWPSPDQQKKVRLFVCGPTVYDNAHIGHARTYIFFDFFAKYLRSQEYDVDYLQNITDIDDKIIKRAGENGETPLTLAKKFSQAYFADMKSLGIDAVNRYAPATDFITQIVAQVERLIEKGFAYKIDGDGWYFDISKDEDYGKLSGRTMEQAEDATSRIDDSISKKNRGDFCLWKFSKPGEPIWNTQLGEGRPGWHIEDTAITEYYFGPQYDIHGGGLDLKFPHHEAEIAQQESASGLKPFVQIWMHTGALLVEGKKMSKSLGNFITIRDFLKKYPPESLRLLILKNHYRSPMDYTDALAEEAKVNLETLHLFLAKLKMASEKNDDQRPLKQKSAPFESEFQKALADDMNTTKALSIIFNRMATAQSVVWEIDREAALLELEQFAKALGQLGFSFKSPEIPPKIAHMAAQAEEFRSNKQFAHADALRKEIEGLGYSVENTPRGPFLWPQKNPN